MPMTTSSTKRLVVLTVRTGHSGTNPQFTCSRAGKPRSIRVPACKPWRETSRVCGSCHHPQGWEVQRASQSCGVRGSAPGCTHSPSIRKAGFALRLNTLFGLLGFLPSRACRSKYRVSRPLVNRLVVACPLESSLFFWKVPNGSQTGHHGQNILSEAADLAAVKGGEGQSSFAGLSFLSL